MPVLRSLPGVAGVVLLREEFGYCSSIWLMVLNLMFEAGNASPPEADYRGVFAKLPTREPPPQSRHSRHMLSWRTRHDLNL